MGTLDNSNNKQVFKCPGDPEARTWCGFPPLNKNKTNKLKQGKCLFLLFFF